MISISQRHSAPAPHKVKNHERGSSGALWYGRESNDLKASTVQSPGPQDGAVNREAVNHSAKLQLKKVALKRESNITVGKWTPPNGENH